MNELSMTLPGSGWVDRTSNRLQIQAPDGTLIMLEVERRDAKSAEETAEYAEVELRRMSRSHRGFSLLAREEFSLGAVQGIRLSFRSMGSEGALHHELVYMPLSTALMILVVNGHAAHAEACTEILRQAVESIQLR